MQSDLVPGDWVDVAGVGLGQFIEETDGLTEVLIGCQPASRIHVYSDTVRKHEGPVIVRDSETGQPTMDINDGFSQEMARQGKWP